MAKRKTNKRTVDLLKSNAVSFRNKISRLLLLSSRDERKQFCNEIIRNGILRSKIQHVQYANTDTPDYIKPGHGGAHQPDEFISIDKFIEGMKLFAKILLNVDEVL